MVILILVIGFSVNFADTNYKIKYICEGSDFETPVYIISSKIETPVVMIMSGTHGNEPAGIAAVKKMKDNINIQKGTLIFIPNANIIACEKEMRSYPEGINLNRVYPGKKDGNDVEKIAYEIFNLMKSFHVDFLFDLHESREFYKINPQNYGQTIVLDCYDDDFLKICSGIQERLNRDISNEQEKFEILIKPIEGCATYAASCQLGIPSFTFETCRKLPFPSRVAIQETLIKMVLEHVGLME